MFLSVVLQDTSCKIQRNETVLPTILQHFILSLAVILLNNISPKVQLFENVTLLQSSLRQPLFRSFRHHSPGCGRTLYKTQFACYFVPYRSSYHLEYVHNRTPVLFAQVLICSANWLCIFCLFCFSFAVDSGSLFSRSLINKMPSSAASPLGVVLFDRVEECDILICVFRWCFESV